MPVVSASNDFIDTLRFGATVVVADLRVFEYSDNGSVVQDYLLPVSTCSITVDRNSAIRRSGSLTVVLEPSIPPSALMPTGLPLPGIPQPLGPFGNEVGISLGLAAGDNRPVKLATLSADAPAGAGSAAMTIPNSTDIAIGDTLVIGSASPVVVSGVTTTGGDSYTVYFEPNLSTTVLQGQSVQVVEFVPIGLFTITTTVVDAETSTLTVTIDLSDRSFVIDARKLISPYTFPKTKSGRYADELMALLSSVWGTNPNLPSLRFNLSASNNPVIPVCTYNQGSSPWQMAQDLAQVSGNELFIDVNGVVVSRPYPDPTQTPVSWYFTTADDQIFSNPTKGIASGSPYSIPVAVQTTFTRDGIYNDVYVTGSGSNNAPGISTSSSTATGTVVSTSTSSSSPVLGHSADTSPGSATDTNGPLGDLAEFVQSNIVPTTSQAQAMASLDLSLSRSSAWQVQVTSPPNPLFDIDDVVSVNYPSVGVVAPNGLGLCMVIDTITYGVKYSDVATVTGRIIPGRYA